MKVLTLARGGSELPDGSYGWSDQEGLKIFYAKRWARPDFGPGILPVVGQLIAWAEVVHCYSVFGTLLPILSVECARRKVPLILSPEGSLLPEARRSKGWKKRPYEALILRPALKHLARVVTASEPEARAIQAQFPDVPTSVVHNGVEFHEVLPALERGGPPYLIYLGRLHPYKRIEVIIEAFAGSAAKQGWELRIAGDGPTSYRLHLESVARQLGVIDKVRLLGFLRPPALAKALSGAEGLVMASRSEGFGMSVAEALAHGTPCVLARPTAWEEIEQRNCGFVANGTAESLASQIRALMEVGEPARRAMGASGREWMRQAYSWDMAASGFLEVYGQALRGRVACDFSS